MLTLSFRPFRTVMVAAVLSAVAASPAGATSTAQATVKAMSAKQSKRLAPRPDLVARSLRLDFLADGLSVEAKIANTGNRRARRSDVSIAISTDEILDEQDEVLEDISVPRVQPGVERSVSTEVEIPADLPDGDLFLLVCADGNTDVKERNETNNCTSQLVVSAADNVSEDGEADEAEDDDDSDDDVVDDSEYDDQ